jgi:DNA-binding response OmpR family regulator
MSHEHPAVLVVDDEPDTCANLSDILHDLGYAVDVAHDGTAALELIRKRSYDVALLDLKMPGMNGLELYRRIKKLRASTVAIIVTAYASDAAASEALEAGAWRVLAKPVDFSRLLTLVEEAAEQPLVLVVDDDHDLCDAMWDLLRNQGYRVSLAHSLDEAQVQLHDAALQVALIDMKLPQTNGQEVFRLIRQSSPMARTIVITGHREEMDQQIQTIVAEGADAVCYKPFDIKSLLHTIKGLAHY